MTNILDDSDNKLLYKLLKQIVEGSRDASAVIHGTTIVTCNTPFIELLGYQNKDEIIGTDALSLFIPEEKEKIRNYVTTSPDTDKTSELSEYHIQRRDGANLNIEGSFSLIRNDDTPLFLVFLRDITEKHQAEQKIELLHTHAIQLNEIESIDTIGKITLDIMQKTLGYTYVSFQLLSDDHLVVVDSIGGEFASKPLQIYGNGITVKAARESKSILANDVREEVAYVDGFRGTLSELAVPIRAEDTVLGVLNIESNKLNAFTENDRKLMEILAMHVGCAISKNNHIKELSEINDKYQVEMVENFHRITSMVRHDLRSPHTSISLVVDLLRKNPEKIDEYLEIIEKNLTFSENILSDLSQFIYTWKISPEPVFIHELVTATIDTIIIPPSIEVDVIIDPALSHNLDSKSIQRVLYNLITNAIYAIKEKGRITISAQKNHEMLEISVSDTGGGINADIQSRLFTPFTTDKPDGIGLGLAYCKQAVESHNGTISFVTNINRGSNFIVRIP